jgi:hypothetical protein
MEQCVKEYSDVLVLARGLAISAIAEAANGFSLKDVIVIASNNYQAAMDAFVGSGLIGEAWKTHTEECSQLTLDFAIDTACDCLHVPAGAEGVSFKETNELLDAVKGITLSIISKLPGGFKLPELVPVAMENWSALTLGVEGANKIGGEFKGDVRSFIKFVVRFAFDFTAIVKAAMTAPAV